MANPEFFFEGRLFKESKSHLKMILLVSAVAAAFDLPMFFESVKHKFRALTAPMIF